MAALEGGSPTALMQFMSSNPNRMFPVDDNNAIAGADYWAFSGGTPIGTLDLSITTVPEPAGWLLLAIGGIGLHVFRRRHLAPRQ